jgi:hypothetical protein
MEETEVGVLEWRLAGGRGEAIVKRRQEVKDVHTMYKSGKPISHLRDDTACL